jgi:hypothetical protein
MAACTQCGQRTAPGARWCTQCGTPVPDVSLVVRPRTTAYDPPALIDVAAGSSSTLDVTPAPPSRNPDVAAATAAFNPVPPPPPQPVTRQTAATPPPPPARDHRIQPGVLIALIGTLVLVVALVAVVAVTNLGGDGEPGDDAASADGSGSDATEVAADAEVAVPDTAPDGQDAEGNAVSYAPANLLDGDPSSTWRMPGDAAGDEITLSWAEPVTITGVGMVNGYAKVDEATGDERYGQNRRVLGVTWVFDDGTEFSKTLEETEDMQSFQLDAPVETSSVTIRIDDTSDPGGRDFTAVSELSFLAG